MPFPNDPLILDVGCDVVIRFKGHKSYGGQQNALKAMARRAAAPQEECRQVFEALCRVYDQAVDAIVRHRRTTNPLKRGIRYASLDDIDFDACMRELDGIEPGEAMHQKGQILNWVIYWHYLK